jgi:hypothetical protein
MKLQKTTVALIAIALILGGGVLVAENRRNPQQAAVDQAEGASSPVFTFDEAAVTALHIETDGQAVTFERDDDGFWQMTEPESGPAEEAAIAFLLSRLTTDGLTQTLTMAETDQEAFGLAVPFATVDLTLADGTTHQLILGGADFSGQNSYALVDPDSFSHPRGGRSGSGRPRQPGHPQWGRPSLWWNGRRSRIRLLGKIPEQFLAVTMPRRFPARMIPP